MHWRLLSPFDLPRILPVGGSLLVPRSLPGPPGVREELMQVVTMVPGQGGRFHSVVPLTLWHWLLRKQRALWGCTNKQTGGKLSNLSLHPGFGARCKEGNFKLGR